METENITKPMNQITDKYNEISDKTRETAKQVYSVTDSWVHENPWWTVGMVAVTALIVGMLLGQTTSRD